MVPPQRLKKKICPVTCPRMVAERCCDYGISAVVELIRRVLEHTGTRRLSWLLVGKSVKSDTTLLSELTVSAVCKISLRD